MSRTRPAIFWVRAVHRWISMSFVLVAAILLIGLTPIGTPLGDLVSAVAIALLLLLAASGIWVAVHHYAVGARATRRRRAAAAPTS